jgi:hypothetical protein
MRDFLPPAPAEIMANIATEREGVIMKPKK